MGRAALGGQSGVAAEAAYAEGEAGNEAVCWARLWSMVDSGGDVGAVALEVELVEIGAGGWSVVRWRGMVYGGLIVDCW